MEELSELRKRIIKLEIQKRQLEELNSRLVFAFDELVDAVCLFDQKGSILFLNHACKTLFGFAPHEDFRGKIIFEYYTSQAKSLLLQEAMPHVSQRGSWKGQVAVLAPVHLPLSSLMSVQHPPSKRQEKSVNLTLCRSSYLGTGCHFTCVMHPQQSAEELSFLKELVREFPFALAVWQMTSTDLEPIQHTTTTSTSTTTTTTTTSTISSSKTFRLVASNEEACEVTGLRLEDGQSIHALSRCSLVAPSLTPAAGLAMAADSIQLFLEKVLQRRETSLPDFSLVSGRPFSVKAFPLRNNQVATVFTSLLPQNQNHQNARAVPAPSLSGQPSLLIRPPTREALDSLHGTSLGLTLVEKNGPNSFPIMYANDGFCSMTCFSREELVNRNCFFLFRSGETADCAESLAQLELALRSESGSPHVIEVQLLRKDTLTGDAHHTPATVFVFPFFPTTTTSTNAQQQQTTTFTNAQQQQQSQQQFVMIYSLATNDLSLRPSSVADSKSLQVLGGGLPPSVFYMIFEELRYAMVVWRMVDVNDVSRFRLVAANRTARGIRRANKRDANFPIGLFFEDVLHDLDPSASREIQQLYKDVLRDGKSRLFVCHLNLSSENENFHGGTFSSNIIYLSQNMIAVAYESFEDTIAAASAVVSGLESGDLDQFLGADFEKSCDCECANCRCKQLSSGGERKSNKRPFADLLSSDSEVQTAPDKEKKTDKEKGKDKEEKSGTSSVTDETESWAMPLNTKAQGGATYLGYTPAKWRKLFANPMAPVTSPANTLLCSKCETSTRSNTSDLPPPILYQIDTDESDTRFLSTFQRALVGIAILRTDGTVWNANDLFCSTLGYSEDVLIGKPISSFAALGDLGECASAIRQVASGDLPVYEMTRKFVQKQGEVLNCLVGFRLERSPKGDPHFIMMFLHSLPLLKKKFKNLFTNEFFFKVFSSSGLPSAVILMNANMCFCAVNKACCLLFSCLSRDLVDHSMLILFPGDDQAKSLSDLALKMMEEDIGSPHQIVVHHRKKTGELVSCLLTMSLVGNDIGEASHIICYFQLISDLHEIVAKVFS
eukprot:TRINITY_DN8279_c0_g1_i1.p1 TRINITY_DN8279_c0_g1~~TRINITY_DN8279_c0_g1_i1.p1  ORF type:complete len:1059 (-),score=248.44 TRINITY_DN8279_c0_g1_i1:233-3409(-)